jgi:SAM-dependent methyltransferase
MLAPHDLPPEYAAWNGKHGAPSGRWIPGWMAKLARVGQPKMLKRYRGPFAWQINNDTRIFEYAWAYDQISQQGSVLNVVDVGGGLGGMQWVLSRAGHTVTNVDPGLEAAGTGFSLNPETHRAFCEVYRAPVRLVSDTIENAGLADESVDVILSVSALEHFSAQDLESFTRTVPRVLKPGGALVLSIDLFANLRPFTDRRYNAWGVNIDVAQLVAATETRMKLGTPAELNGFPEFDARRILAHLEDYLLGGYPALTQLVVAAK